MFSDNETCKALETYYSEGIDLPWKIDFVLISMN